MIPIPVGSVDAVAFINIDNHKLKISNWKDIQDRSVGIVKGILFIDKAAVDADLKDLTRVTKLEQLVRMVKSNRLEVGVDTKDSFVEFRSNKSIYNDVLLVEQPLTSVPLFHYIHKDHADLIPKLTKALEDMRDEGRIQFHVDHYFKSLE